MFPHALRFEFDPPGVQCYSTVLTAEILANWRDTNTLVVEAVRIENTSTGREVTKYQRLRKRRRISQIRTFIEDYKAKDVPPPILPQAVVLNCRENIRPVRIIKDEICELPQNKKFHVVDGQHRIEALSELNDETPIPATITAGLDAMQEAALFLLMNHTQKSVPAEVRLLNIAGMRRSKRWRKYHLKKLFTRVGFRGATREALDLAAEQALTKGNFWYDKVDLPEDEEE